MLDNSTLFVYPGDDGAKLMPKSRYENFIGVNGVHQKMESILRTHRPPLAKLFVRFRDLIQKT